MYSSPPAPYAYVPPPAPTYAPVQPGYMPPPQAQPPVPQWYQPPPTFAAPTAQYPWPQQPTQQPQDQAGAGFFGPLTGPSGQPVQTPVITADVGRGPEPIPVLVPGLNQAEFNSLLAGQPPSKEIELKAQAYAELRVMLGRSVWPEPGEVYPPPNFGEPQTEAELKAPFGGGPSVEAAAPERTTEPEPARTTEPARQTRTTGRKARKTEPTRTTPPRANA